MPAPPPELYVVNLLEAAVLTLDPDGAVAGKDVERLVDRDIGKECEDSGVAGTRTWHFDLGVGTHPAVSRFILYGSNLAGETFTLESSPDNAAWTTRDATFVPAADGSYRHTFASLAAPRYWRLTVTDPAAPVRIAEAFLTAPLVLAFKPSGSELDETPQPNVSVLESFGGRAWGVKRGPRRWTTSYNMTFLPDSDIAVTEAILDGLEDGALPFWLWTIRSELRWVRLEGTIQRASAEVTAENWNVGMRFIEELP